MELADGTKTMNVAVKRGDAELTLKDDGNDIWSVTVRIIVVRLMEYHKHMQRP